MLREAKPFGLAKFYESWHAAEPGKSYDAKASEWRAKLKQAEAAAPTD